MTKKILFQTAILFLLTLAACTKTGISSSGNSNVTNIVTQGNWRISLYNDSGTDELFHFSGYTFTFNNGTVTATKAGATVSGTYSAGVDDSKSKMYLDFGVTIPFNKLNDDWHIISETSTKISLQDVSGGNGGTDLLTFEKI